MVCQGLFKDIGHVYLRPAQFGDGPVIPLQLFQGLLMPGNLTFYGIDRGGVAAVLLDPEFKNAFFREINTRFQPDPGRDVGRFQTQQIVRQLKNAPPFTFAYQHPGRIPRFVIIAPVFLNPLGERRKPP